MTRSSDIVKRALDVAVSATALALLAPLLIALGVVVRIDGGPPVLYRQLRSGRGGRPFTMFKFRTMRDDDSAAADEHATARITRSGRWLRATSLDELPSLVNVVRGDMSLVGPRPLPIRYLARYDDTEARRLEVRPGITGWALIAGRNGVPWDDRLARDVHYVEHRSLALDLRILAETVPLLLGRRDINNTPEITMTELRRPDG